jgi:pSer/pThr/pTyr-binding forkhead associated (FHA) protein
MIADSVVEDPSSLHRSTPVELKDRNAAERAGVPFLLYRDGEGSQRIVPLAPDRGRISVGRLEDNAIPLDWDTRVSRVHAELEPVGGQWVVEDDGLSRNGTFVNGERLRGRRRLHDGDVVRVGDTALAFRDPAPRGEGTELGAGPDDIDLSTAQRRVLVALCRPYLEGDRFATPASNQAIADELVLSVDGVKTHVRTLFDKFGLGERTRTDKRLELAKRAVEWGIVSERDLGE